MLISSKSRTKNDDYVSFFFRLYLETNYMLVNIADVLASRLQEAKRDEEGYWTTAVLHV